MFDPNTLAQLNQLKADIHASKEYATGVVAGSSGRYGFVRLDDGRDTFLSPEKMDRVLPGDQVKIEVKETPEGKLEAILEKLLESPLKRFIGQYRVRGKGHFVAPTGVQCNRWIFIPPKARKHAKEGDFVITEITQHPFRDGKAQAKVVFRIGQPDEAYIEHKYIRAKFDLNHRQSDAQSKQFEIIENAFGDQSFGERQDLTALPFVTIDAETTMDMDDALTIETGPDAQTPYRVHVAIADPSSFIEPGSVLAIEAQKYAQSVYLLGGAVPMLPKRLSNHCFSLEEAKNRPALVCSLDIASDGNVQNFEFKRALICSKHKLSYNKVAAGLTGADSDALPADIKPQMEQLQAFATLRRSYRERTQLLNPDQTDYDYQLDETGKIASIAARPRNIAHQIVEESMLATNMCAGDFLAEHQVGLSVQHNGFRKDRIGEVHALLKEEGISSDDSVNQLIPHVKLLHDLANDDAKKTLLPALRRLMRGGELTPEHNAHLGLGVEHYATITSPIRRFADLFNHWSIMAILTASETPTLTNDELTAVNEAIQNGRAADRELQQWLITQFTENLIGQEASGHIRIVTQQGFGVRIDDTGIDGFVLFPKKQAKTFDAKRMTLEVEGRLFRLEDEVKINIAGVDMDKRRIAFELAN